MNLLIIENYQITVLKLIYYLIHLSIQISKHVLVTDFKIRDFAVFLFPLFHIIAKFNTLGFFSKLFMIF